LKNGRTIGYGSENSRERIGPLGTFAPGSELAFEQKAVILSEASFSSAISLCAYKKAIGLSKCDIRDM